MRKDVNHGGHQQERMIIETAQTPNNHDVIIRVCLQVRQWVPGGKNAVTVVRFLGTTPQSSSVLSLLNSVCAQIARNYDVTFQACDVISELVQRMGELLRCASAKEMSDELTNFAK